MGVFKIGGLSCAGLVTSGQAWEFMADVVRHFTLQSTQPYSLPFRFNM